VLGVLAGGPSRRGTLTEFYELLGVGSEDATEINKLGEEVFEACGGDDQGPAWRPVKIKAR
jgi:hypothetical protein